jgi:chorismate mutase / prephenate dehydratase
MNEQKDVRRIRKAIDETDDGILELIERRLELAREMAAAKPEGEGHSPLRPAREAAILGRLRQRARSASAPLIEIVWRELIGQGRQVQGPMRLVLFTRDNTRLLEECARRHFSSAIEVEWVESREAAVEAARREPVIAALDREVDDSELTSLGEIRTATGEPIGFAYARVTAEKETP